ncbi:hypothetical protein [Cohnella candidum]|uniref:Uncharacterized protein n=1 Tax=Cohnella candidum TaxID=2674991 RepID=A0A3G3K6K8_9BACL|nr:hypothetical protein [Cohnella candidum]AYQ75399.1 hypothetical protein EAV92_00310 [Cohnella candidum]
MFDPTVFENLKVALENQLYDLDNLTGEIRVVGRTDKLDMALMSREFSLRFELAEEGQAAAEIRLYASLKELASEILEIPGEKPGCVLSLIFELPVSDVDGQCAKADLILRSLWQSAEPPVQTLRFVYGEPDIFLNTAELRFNRKIDEDQMEDLPDLIRHALQSLRELNAV